MNTVSAMRPGVYASYRVIGGQSGKGSAIGVIAASAQGAVMTVKQFFHMTEVYAEYGGQQENIMTAMAKLLFAGGAGSVYCVSVGSAPSQEDYISGYRLLDAMSEITAVVCDTACPSIQKELAGYVAESAGQSRERIVYFGVPHDHTPAQIAQTAKEINCERVCLLAPAVAYEQGGISSGAYLAAAACAQITSKSDPAANLNLLELEGEFRFPAPYSEDEITQLLSAGVTVAEQTGGAAQIIRAVTTKTFEGGEQDSTLRELSTVRIIDDVVPALRNLLRDRLRGAKNNAATRDAIRTQVACELEKKHSAGIIDGFRPPVVYPKADDPTVCMVEVGFDVVYGMHRIELVTYITV